MDGHKLAERVARQIRRLPQDRESLMKAVVGAFSAQELLGERLDQFLEGLIQCILLRTQYTPERGAQGYSASTITAAAARALLDWERDLIESEQDSLMLGRRLHVLVKKEGQEWVAQVTEED